MDVEESLPTPGLRWRPRKDGPVPYWIPRADAVKAGYSSNSYILRRYADDPAALSEKCCALQGQMIAWLDGQRNRSSSTFDGTFRTALRLYQTHEESPFHKLKPGTLTPYCSYLRRLEDHIGSIKIAGTTALDVKRWHKQWSYGYTKLAAGAMAVSVLKSALSFAVVAGHRECRDLLEDIRELKLPLPRARESYAVADQIIAARKAAHSIGRPSAALCFAIQFETTLRMWDVAGQWFPLSYHAPSAWIMGNRKWVGLEWRHIDENLVLRYRPSKTEHSTAREVVVDLRLCPMVMEGLEYVAVENRHGPVIISETSRWPYSDGRLSAHWPQIRRIAGLPETLWCRDLRASGITEARAAGAHNDDAAKLAGHSKPRITSEVYDRASLEAHQRVAKVRVGSRGTPKNVSGNDSAFDVS